MIRVLIVDDSAEVRIALKRIIQTTADIEIGDEAANGMEALGKVEQEDWDVVLLDICLPDISGFEVLRQIKRQKPDMPVLMVSQHSEESFSAEAVRFGASGYLTKDRSCSQLAIAIRTVSAGEQYLSSVTAEQSDSKDEANLNPATKSIPI